MALDDATKKSITDLIEAGKERLCSQYDDPRVSVSGYNMEGVNLLARAEQLILTQPEDDIDRILFQEEIDSVWAAFVQRTNVSTLGWAAEMLSRSR